MNTWVIFNSQVEKEQGTVDKHGRSTDQLTRENWDTWDPMLISEGLFAAANIFSNLKLVYIFSVNPYLGPLQVIFFQFDYKIYHYCQKNDRTDSISNDNINI